MIPIKRFNILALIALILLSTCSQVTSQTSNPKDFGASYQVNPGEEMAYIVKVFKYPLKTYTAQVLLSNHSIDTFNITLGTIIIFKILNKSIDITGTTVIFSQIHIINTMTGYTKDIITNRSTLFFDYAFDNIGNMYAYFDYYQREFNNQTFPKQTVQLTNIAGNYIEFENKIYFNQSYFQIRKKQDWKTGWFESIDTAQFSSTGSLIYEIREDLIQNGANSIFNLNDILNFLLFLSGLLVIFIAFVIVFTYFSSSSKTNNKRPSFKEFLNNKFKKKQKKGGNLGFKTDKALEMIEKILDESKEE